MCVYMHMNFLVQEGLRVSPRSQRLSSHIPENTLEISRQERLVSCIARSQQSLNPKRLPNSGLGSAKTVSVPGRSLQAPE